MNKLNLNLPGNYIERKDLFLQVILFISSIYLAVVNPVLIALILLIIFGNLLFGNRLKLWQIVGLISLLVFFSVDLPAHAIFLKNLEDFLIGLASDSQSSVPPASITLLFNLIRGIFLILVVVATLFAYNQAQQGNDWRPIASQGAMAFGIIMAIDVITELFVGGLSGS